MPAVRSPAKRYRYPFPRERALRHAILSGQRTEALQALDQMFNTLRETCPTLRQLASDAIHLMVVLIRKCHQSGVAVDDMMESILSYSVRIIQANSVADVRSVLLGLTEQLLKAAGQQRLRDRHDIVRKASQYIQAHYHRGLSLEDVAGVVGLSYSYCSRVFSQEMGLSFHEYLTHVRLKAAKQLLLTTPMTVEDVAAQVGYEDASHFIRVFKRVLGMTPRQFEQASARTGAGGEEPGSEGEPETDQQG